MLEIDSVSKRFGSTVALDRMTFTVRPGELYGFVGANGAGKTTTMRIIATLSEPTSGEAYVCGHSVYSNPKEIRRLVGYMPDFFGVYDDMKVIEYLEFFAAAYRLTGAARRARCEEMLDIVDLTFKRDAYANTLSRGQTQRLGLARTLLHDPQVLLLDEPLSGLDPRARIEMRNLLRRLGQMGKTVIVSSHILPELADICNKVGIINRGILEVNASVAEVMRQVRDRVIVKIAVKDQLEKAKQIVEEAPVVDSVVIGDGRLIVTLKAQETDFSALANRLIANGLELTQFAEEETNLESAFMALTKTTGSKM
jgi:ABC-2 type transport system ATP-binding protein